MWAQDNSNGWYGGIFRIFTENIQEDYDFIESPKRIPWS